MADEIDIANESYDEWLTNTIAHQRHLTAEANIHALPAVGQCYNCLSEVEGESRFCDDD